MAEGYFLDAEKYIHEGDIKAAKQLLEELLAIEPAYGPAHNHMGWIYHTKLTNYTMAAKHFKLAQRFAPRYPAGYMNYIYLLAEIGNYQEMSRVMEQAVTVPGIDKSILAYEYAKCFEAKADWKWAKHYYKEAIKLTQLDEVLVACKEALRRVRLKRWYGLW